MSWKKILPMALGVLLVAPATAGAQRNGNDEVVVEAPRQVTGNSNPVRLFDIPALAVHPDDPSTVVMAIGDARAGGCGLHVSRDGGLSWTATVPDLMPEDLPFCIQRPLFPVMAPAFGPDGTLHVAMPASSPETGHPNGPISMLATRTDNLGETHSIVTVAEGERVTVDPADFGQAGEPVEALTWWKSPSLAVDPNNPDKLYLAMRWNAWGTNLQSLPVDVPFRPYVAISEDGGQTWGEPIDIVRNAEGSEIYGALNHDLVVAPDGTLYSFSREFPAPVPEGAPDPERRMLMFKSTDGGQNWEIRPILEDVEDFSAPDAAVDPRTGNLYVIYGGERPGPEDAETSEEIYFTVSEDGGETWSEPVQVTDDESGAPEGCPEDSQSPRCLPTASVLSDSLTPGIDVAPNGRIDVAWYDFRNDPFAGGQGGEDGHQVEQRYWDVYHTHSGDGGVSWSSDIRVTKTTVDGADGATFNNMDVRGPMAIASTDEVAYVAWSDSRPSGQNSDAEDAYFSRIRFTAPAELPGSDAGESRWLWTLLGAGGALAVAGLALFVGLRRAGAGHGEGLAGPAGSGG